MSSGSPSCASIASAAASGSGVSVPPSAGDCRLRRLPAAPRPEERCELGVIGNALAGERARRAVSRAGDLGEAAGGRRPTAGEREERRSESTRHTVPEPRDRRVAVVAVPGEELVCALTGERDRDMLACEAGTRRESRGPTSPRAARPCARRALRSSRRPASLELELVVIGPERSSHLARVGELAHRRSRETDGECLHRLAHLLCHERNDEARVQSAAQHRPEWDVGHQAKSHRLPEPFEERRHVVANVGVGRRSGDDRIPPVRLDLHSPAVDHEAMGRAAASKRPEAASAARGPCRA